MIEREPACLGQVRHSGRRNRLRSRARNEAKMVWVIKWKVCDDSVKGRRWKVKGRGEDVVVIIINDDDDPFPLKTIYLPNTSHLVKQKKKRYGRVKEKGGLILGIL